MKTSKECRQIAPILETVIHGSATEQQIRSVELHIETCAACRAEHQIWQQTTHLVANWKTTPVPESQCNWSDLHARLTTPQPQKLRPALPVRLAMSGAAGAMAIGIFCFFVLRPAPPFTHESTKVETPIITETANSAVSEIPTVTISRQETPSSLVRTTIVDPTVKLKSDTPPLTLVKSDEQNLPLPRKEQAKRRAGSGVREKRPLLTQTTQRPKLQTETPRRVILAVDGETVTPDRDDRYTLAAIPSGLASGDEMPRFVAGGSDPSENPLIPASYSSSEAKTAW